VKIVTKSTDKLRLFYDDSNGSRLIVILMFVSVILLF